ncbi:MAG TPA: D-alanyl-D-alanine carboxypeptidase family protein [Allosphingosinicella sp.]|nr:D-alanyl-D-alanine carboxypeptidase family protein [Allosphingosinicella sp.]
MKRTVRISLALAATAALPAAAQAPVFETPAPVAFMIDLASGAVLYEKEADRRIPPASMAKMMTTHVAFDLIDKGELPLDKQCTVRPETWRAWHSQGSTSFLEVNGQYSVEHLLHGIVTQSGNDATVVLAECIAGTEQAFVQLMNRDSRELGLKNSNWGNPVGWPDGGVTQTTARDLATLARATIEQHPKLYRQFYAQPSFTSGRQLGSGEAITQGNRNPILGKVQGADGLKTGHTEEAGYGFTGSAEQNGRRLIMVVTGLGSTQQRIDESVKFLDWGFRAWQTRPLFQQGARVGEAQVQLGGSNTVGLVAPRNMAATIPAGLGRRFQARIVYQGPVKAPIEQGQHIADLVVQAEGMPAMTMPLVAEEAVSEVGFFGRIWSGFKNLVGMA